VHPLIWVVVAATALSGVFALVAHVLRSFRRVELEQAFSGVKGRRRFERLHRHLDALRLMASLLRALSNIVLIVAIVVLFDVPSGSSWEAYVAPVGLALALIAVFGVAIPYAWAEYAGEKALAVCFSPLMALRVLLWPVIGLMQIFDVPIRRLSGAPAEPTENGDAAKQEILQAASEGHAEGAVDAEEVEMIESVMELDETEAGEIMTPRTDIMALPVETGFAEACAKITEAGHTRVPVFETDLDSIIGILYAKDLLQYVSATQPPRLRDIMHQPFFVPTSKALDELLTEFKTRHIHLAVVLDEYGGTAGLVTVEDIIEEIVGDIADEYDKAEPESITLIDARTAEIDGRFYIDDLNDVLKLEIPEDEDYDTAAGLVISELGHIPDAGEQVEAFGARFTVISADERKITRLRVEVDEGEGGEKES